jgi:hypothetical protein
MMPHKPGRPAKPESKRRQQLHISLYPEDIRRLDALTDNRSEFLRQCIAKAWAEKHDGETTVTIKLPKRLLHGLLTTVTVEAPSPQVNAMQTLVEQIAPDSLLAREELAREELAREEEVEHAGLALVHAGV